MDFYIMGRSAIGIGPGWQALIGIPAGHVLFPFLLFSVLILFDQKAIVLP